MVEERKVRGIILVILLRILARNCCRYVLSRTTPVFMTYFEGLYLDLIVFEKLRAFRLMFIIMGIFKAGVLMKWNEILTV